jgi:two-component system, OmpR family, phosphate regulon sensor histidine kinase PhoR
MKLRFQWKLMILFILLLLLLLLLQAYSHYFLKYSLFFSSSIALVIVIFFTYLLTRFLAQPIYDLTQKAIHLVSSHSDQKITVRSREELRMLSKAIDEIGIQLQSKIDETSKERDYLQAILKGMAEGVLVVDERGRILVANDALQQFLFLPSNVANRTPLEIIRNAKLEEAIRKVLREGNTTSFELNLPMPLGKTFEVNVVGIMPSPEEMEKGDEGIRGAIAVFHDITRLKELEKIRQDFVANVSHELRTPLTTIKGYAETLLDGALKEEVAFQFVQIIKKHSDRLTKIVEDLLALSKIETKGFYLNLEKISIHGLIDDVINFVREAAEKKKISVTKKDVSPSLSALADRAYLEQVLVNLCDNAIKYGREGGEITLSAIEKVHGEVEFSVRDDGIGIPKEDLPRIFERFYRVDKGRSQELGGTGLGLSIVKHLVHAHGGRVWAESQLGEGSTFYFTLPAFPGK